MNVFCLLHIEADLIQAKDHLLTLLSGHMTEGQRSALCLLQQLCRIDGKICHAFSISTSMNNEVSS